MHSPTERSGFRHLSTVTPHADRWTSPAGTGEPPGSLGLSHRSEGGARPNPSRDADPVLGDLPMHSIRRSHIEAWVKHMAASLAATTINTRYTIIRSVLRAAVADQLIARDPTDGVVLPRKRKAEAAMSIPDHADVAKLLNAAEPENRPKSRPGFSAYVALCAFAGLRRGEALGVQVGNIDFLARTLRVRRQIQGPSRPTSQPAGTLSRPLPGSQLWSGHRNMSPSAPSTCLTNS